VSIPRQPDGLRTIHHLRLVALDGLAVKYGAEIRGGIFGNSLRLTWAELKIALNRVLNEKLV
jgi:hypothetical protein